MLKEEYSEAAVLSAVFYYGYDAYIDVQSILKEDSFSVEIHKIIWACINECYKDGQARKLGVASIVSAANSVGYKNVLLTKENQTLLNNLTQPVTVELLGNVIGLAKKIRRLEIARKLALNMRSTANEIQTNVTGEESINNILAYAEQPALNLATDEEEQHIIDMSNGVIEFIDNLVENPVDQIGIPTGFPEYDKSIGGGLRPQSVSIIGARAKVGKSMFAANVIKNCLDTSIPVLYLDTEMNYRDQLNRMLAIISGVDSADIETGKFGKNGKSMDLVYQAGNFLKDYPFYHYKNVSGCDFKEILSYVRRWLVKTVGVGKNNEANSCVVIYDYLKLMDSSSLSKNIAEYQVMGFQMTELQNFAVKYQIPVLAFVQLNKDGITDESLASISQSDRIGWLCTNFSILKPLSDDEIISELAKKGVKRKLVPIASRYSSAWDNKDFICLSADFPCSRMFEVGTYLSLTQNTEFTNESIDDLTF